MITFVTTMVNTALIIMKDAMSIVMAEWEHIQAEDTEAAQETVIVVTEAI